MKIQPKKEKGYRFKPVTLRFHLAEGPGFEPGLTGPEPVVLPLDDPSVVSKADNYNIYLNASSKFWSWDIGKNFKWLAGLVRLKRLDRLDGWEKNDGRRKTASLRRGTIKRPCFKLTDLSIVIIEFVFFSSIFPLPSPFALTFSPLTFSNSFTLTIFLNLPR